jgi:aspartyl-tRNA(Asn)/glutamyl-tRNA(Gln) amidotransferase subunit A
MITVREVASAVREGRTTARAVAAKTIKRLKARNWEFNAATRILEARALADADAVDAKVAAGEDPGLLAGVPFGVKDLFDITGQPTTAGARNRVHAVPAPCDAEVVARLHDAGAVLVCTLNMDEFAYGFSTINAHSGTTRNPHDLSRLAGGSSGGSAAAVAANFLPFALGSDTNGSIRVPAALCGLYGLKPTHGDLPMGGVFPFVDSFDDVGALTKDIEDLRLVCGVMRGPHYGRVDSPRRIAVLDGWFGENIGAETAGAIARVADALGAGTVGLEGVAEARSAAFVMTAYEGGNLHLPALRLEAMGYDPGTRDRLIAGAMLSREAYEEARRLRRWFIAEIERLFRDWDVLIAPAAPGPAPLAADPMVEINGVRVPARAHLGLHTQPISFAGLPSLAVPLKDCGPLPIGIQLIGPRGTEPRLFALAEKLESLDLAGAWPGPA